jgi:hypothetical protein
MDRISWFLQEDTRRWLENGISTQKVAPSGIVKN